MIESAPMPLPNSLDLTIKTNESMKSSAIKRLGILFTLVLLAVTSACQQQKTSNSSPNQELPRERVVGKPGGSLTYRLTSPPQTFNHLGAKEEASLVVSFFLLGARLVEFDQDQQRHVPGLAESWKWAEDKRTLEVTLRDGLKFSDGHPLTADDVLFTIQAMYDERTASPIFREPMMINGRPIEATVVDARHLRMLFPEAVAAPEGYLSNISVLPRHALGDALTNGTLKEAWGITSDPRTIITAGPFMVERATPGERVDLKRNPNYWKKDSAGNALPYLDTFVLVVVDDANNAMARLQQNGLDIVDRIRPSDYASLRSSQGAVRPYDLGPGLTTDHMWFNQNDGMLNGKPVVDPIKRGWFSDTRFRRAISHAIDRKSIAANNLQGLATPLYGFVSPGNRVWGASDIPHTEYDLEKARALLQEAGFTVRGTADAPELFDAKGNRVEFTLIVPTENQLRKEMAAVLQQDLAKLGINMQVAPIEFQALTARWTQSFDYDAVLLGLSVTDPDPSSYAGFVQSSSANHQWFPKEPKPSTEWEARLDELAAAQARESDPERRKAIFSDIQKLIAEQLPIIPIVARHIVTAANTRVGNYRPGPILPYSLWNAEELFVKQ
ncbi:MAG: peptide/nickel transport system substrate-binding protein [Acidobacteriota bacterium]|nr:peptide/nickel transport system substrate-binding protein [Acidobacteriota bacterium]